MTGGGEEVGICRGGGDKGLSEKPRPLDALLSRARAWEIESREGAVRSSSSESDRQMGSGGEEEERGWRLEVRADAEVGRDGLEVMVRGGLWIQRPSLALALGPGTILLLTRFPVR